MAEERGREEETREVARNARLFRDEEMGRGREKRRRATGKIYVARERGRKRREERTEKGE